MTFQTQIGAIYYPIRVFNTQTYQFDISENVPESQTRTDILNIYQGEFFLSKAFTLENNGFYLIYYPYMRTYHVTRLEMSWANLFINISSSYVVWRESNIEIVGRIHLTS